MNGDQETTTDVSSEDHKPPIRAGRPVAKRPDVARVKPPDLPGGGKLLLWLGLGCGTFIVIMSVAAGLGIYGLVSVIKTAELEKLFAGPPPVVPFGEGPGEVFDPEKMPEPPLELPMPPAAPTRLGNADLTAVDEHQLAGLAHQFYDKGNYQAAIKCQSLGVIKTGEGRYNLACYYARAGNIEAAMYWLQAGAKEEESNAAWASEDGDLVRVRQDPRWPALLDYMRTYQRYWEMAASSETALILPRDAAPGQPLPVFIGLHGLGHNAHGFVDSQTYQPLADELGVAFLGVSGTTVRGRKHFVWSEDPVKDLERIESALRETADRLTPAPGKAVLFGFSQGGMVAAELAARYPEKFAGAIALSPGSVSDLPPPSTTALPEHRRQGIVAVCGAQEHRTTRRTTEHYVAAFKALGARVYVRQYAGVSEHRFPPDYMAKFPVWARFILDPDAPVPVP